MAEGYTPRDTKNGVNKDIKSSEKDEEYFTSVPSSPPKMVSMEEVMKMKTKVEKMMLTHAIAMEDDFKLEKKEVPAASLEGRVREIMEKAFWDVLDEELKEDPPEYNQALNLLTEIKQELLELLTPNAQSMKATIEEVLDLDLIRQKLQHNAFNLSTYTAFIIEVLEKSCAPARDEQVAQLKKITPVVPLYQEIFKLLDVMKLDLANFTIKVAKPMLKKHSTEYERKQFFELLKLQSENGVDGLLYTKMWLSNAFQNVLKQSSSQPPNSSSSSSSSSSSPTLPPPPITNPSHLLHSTICEAYLALIFSDIDTPETLLMDAGRLLDLKNQLGAILLTAVAMVIVSATVARQLDEEFKRKLKSQVFILSSENLPIKTTPKEYHERSLALSDQIVKEVNGWLVERGVEKMVEGVEQSLRSQIISCLDPSSSSTPVLTLMAKRLKAFFLQILSSQSKKDFTIPQGFSSLSDELTSLAGSFIHVITHNQSVYRDIYNDLITDLIRKRNNPSPDSSIATTSATTTTTSTAATTSSD